MSEKVDIFNGNSGAPINSQGTVFLPSSCNESSRGQNRPRRGWGGVGCKKASVRVGGWGLIVVLGDIREGCNSAGHVAIWENDSLECSWGCVSYPHKIKRKKKKTEPCLSGFLSEVLGRA